MKNVQREIGSKYGNNSTWTFCQADENGKDVSRKAHVEKVCNGVYAVTLWDGGNMVSSTDFADIFSAFDAARAYAWA